MNPFGSRWEELFYCQHKPTDRLVCEFGQWLREKPNKVQEVVLYHGTDANLPIPIEGLRPTSPNRRRSLQSASGFVYLSVFPGMARDFGSLGNPGRQIVVYEVRVLIGQLKPDTDQLNNQRAWAEMPVKNTLAHSLIFGHGARVRGRISPGLIRLMS